MASLDAENVTKVQDALSRLIAGKTVLVIAHRMHTVEAADKMDGTVAEEEPPSLLMEEHGLFSHIEKERFMETAANPLRSFL